MSGNLRETKDELIEKIDQVGENFGLKTLTKAIYDCFDSNVLEELVEHLQDEGLIL